MLWVVREVRRFRAEAREHGELGEVAWRDLAVVARLAKRRRKRIPVVRTKVEVRAAARLFRDGGG